MGTSEQRCNACRAIYVGRHKCPKDPKNFTPEEFEAAVKRMAAEEVQRILADSFGWRADRWWAAREEVTTWQDEQKRLDELWGNRPKHLGVQVIEHIPSQITHYGTDGLEDYRQYMRTYAWLEDQDRGRPCWREVSP